MCQQKQRKSPLSLKRKWKCWKCGACCKVAGKVDPEFDRGDGVCKQLDDENLCAIYQYRPEICRVKPESTDSELFRACTILEASQKGVAV